VQKIIENGYGYVSNESVYFDTNKYLTDGHHEYVVVGSWFVVFGCLTGFVLLSDTESLLRAKWATFGHKTKARALFLPLRRKRTKRTATTLCCGRRARRESRCGTVPGAREDPDGTLRCVVAVVLVVLVVVVVVNFFFSFVSARQWRRICWAKLLTFTVEDKTCIFRITKTRLRSARHFITIRDARAGSITFYTRDICTLTDSKWQKYGRFFFFKKPQFFFSCSL
jgi:hypothetical protein